MVLKKKFVVGVDRIGVANRRRLNWEVENLKFRIG